MDHGYKAGDRIEVTGVMVNDPAPMEVGATGTVTHVTEPLGGLSGQLWVEWDNGRTLAVLIPEDLPVIRRAQ